MEKQYLTIMIQSLQNKVKVLDQILDKNSEQSLLLKKTDTDWDGFDRNADEKGILIDELNKLDEGFENLYEHVKELLEDEGARKIYADEIQKMQSLITEITERSIKIQAEEARNKKLVEQRFKESREQIRHQRTSSKAARDYYQNMIQMNYVPPQFLDNKK